MVTSDLDRRQEFNRGEVEKNILSFLVFVIEAASFNDREKGLEPQLTGPINK